jgi:hypothetical protein
MHPNDDNQSDRQIAEYIGVMHKTVTKYRRQMNLKAGGDSRHLKKRTGRDGKDYQSNVSMLIRKRSWPYDSTLSGFRVLSPLNAEGKAIASLDTPRLSD